MSAGQQSKLIKQIPVEAEALDEHGERATQPQAENAHSLAVGADYEFWSLQYGALINQAKSIKRRFLGGEMRCKKCGTPFGKDGK